MYKNLLLKILLLVIVILINTPTWAQQAAYICTQSITANGGTNCIPVTASNPFPISVFGGSNGQCFVSNGVKGVFTTCPSGSSISLTTSGTSGASTLVGSVLNIPVYSSGGGSTSLSALTSGTATNTIDSTLFSQTWNWSTLTTQTSLSLTATALTTGTVLNLAAPNATTGQALTLKPALGLASGGTACTTTNCYYGFPNFRTKLANVQHGTGNARLCLAGDSTIFGSWSNLTDTTGITFTGLPPQLSNYLSTSFGLKATWQGFLGDQGTTETFGTKDSRIVLGQFTQDATITTIGGAAYSTTVVNGTALTFTPTTNVDTFRFLYIIQSGGGTLSVQVDSGTPTTYNTNGASGIGVATVTAGSVASHTIKFTMSAGTKASVVGVSDAYDSTQSWVNIVNAGWPAAKASDWATGPTNGYSPANVASWTALACDLTIYEGGINDWNAAVSASTFAANMQSVITPMLSTGDVALLTPIPSISSSATVALQTSYINQFYSLGNTNSIPVLDIFTTWVSYAVSNPLGFYNPNGGGFHPGGLGYLVEANTLANAIAARPTNINGPMGTSVETGNITAGGNASISGSLAVTSTASLGATAISATGATPLVITQGTASSYANVEFLGTGGGSSQWYTGVGNASETSLGVANKYFWYNGTLRGVIDTNGNFGISNSSPPDKLDVGGAIGITATATTPALGMYSPAANALSITATAGVINLLGGNTHTRRTVSDVNATLVVTDYLLAYSAVTTARVVSIACTLGTTAQPQFFVIKDESGGASALNTLSVTPSSGTIDGGSTKAVVNAAYGAGRIYANGTNCFTW